MSLASSACSDGTDVQENALVPTRPPNIPKAKWKRMRKAAASAIDVSEDQRAGPRVPAEPAAAAVAFCTMASLGTQSGACAGGQGVGKGESAYAWQQTQRLVLNLAQAKFDLAVLRSIIEKAEGCPRISADSRTVYMRVAVAAELCTSQLGKGGIGFVQNQRQREGLHTAYLLTRGALEQAAESLGADFPRRSLSDSFAALVLDMRIDHESLRKLLEAIGIVRKGSRKTLAELAAAMASAAVSTRGDGWDPP